MVCGMPGTPPLLLLLPGLQLRRALQANGSNPKAIRNLPPALVKALADKARVALSFSSSDGTGYSYSSLQSAVAASAYNNASASGAGECIILSVHKGVSVQAPLRRERVMVTLS